MTRAMMTRDEVSEDIQGLDGQQPRVGIFIEHAQVVAIDRVLPAPDFDFPVRAQRRLHRLNERRTTVIEVPIAGQEDNRPTNGMVAAVGETQNRGIDHRHDRVIDERFTAPERTLLAVYGKARVLPFLPPLCLPSLVRSVSQMRRADDDLLRGRSRVEDDSGQGVGEQADAWIAQDVARYWMRYRLSSKEDIGFVDKYMHRLAL